MTKAVTRAGPRAKTSPKRKPAPPQTQEELESYVPYLVNRLSSFGQAAQNRRLSANGLNVVTLRALSVLHIHGTLTVNEIAARAFAEQSTASRAIDAMVQAGLVERRISQADQRRRELALTPAGSDLLHASWPAAETHFEILSEGIDADDIAVCRRVLLQMIENAKRQEP